MLFTWDFAHTHTKTNNYGEFSGGGIAGEEEKGEKGSNLEAGGGASKVALTGDRFLTGLSKPSALG